MNPCCVIGCLTLFGFHRHKWPVIVSFTWRGLFMVLLYRTCMREPLALMFASAIDRASGPFLRRFTNTLFSLPADQPVPDIPTRFLVLAITHSSPVLFFSHPPVFSFLLHIPSKRLCRYMSDTQMRGNLPVAFTSLTNLETL